MVLVQLLLFVSAALFVLYKWATSKYKFFDERGIPYEKPTFLVGNMLPIVFNKASFGKVIKDYYNRNKAHKIIGFFQFREPVFIVTDPQVIKKITVKDFDHFPNHYPFFNTEDDKVLDGMLTVLKDTRWKHMRNTLSPMFTASKMRAMFTLMNECFDDNLKYLREKSLASGETGCELELKECFTRLSNDIIASTAFGLRINSYEKRDNEFYSIGQSVTNFRGAQMLKFLAANLAPKLAKLLGIQFFTPDKTAYFKNLVVDAMKYREQNNIVRPDMIQLLMEAKKESTQKWSDEDIVAQCFIFFFAAFENNANFLSMTCQELMVNPDIQQRLYDEVLETKKELNGAAFNYDVVSQMKYLDMVLSEVLRKYSIAIFTDRVCSKDYKLTDEDENFIFDFKKNDRIWLPIIGLHWDERYFAKPEIFDPERFSDDNKNDIKPYTYLPFGVGPRVCIGNRYALMQTKAMLCYLLLDFKMERSPKSTSDLMSEVRGLQSIPTGGLWMRFVKRK